MYEVHTCTCGVSPGNTGIRVKFVYEGYRVKVKVTGVKKIENPYSRNVKL